MTLQKLFALVRAAIVALAVASFTLIATTARASADMVDHSDLWWNSAESGWGMQLAHRGQVIFVTVYLYDAQGKPTWVTALLHPDAAGWSGDVYVTTGPWFGAPAFDPNAVTRRVAGKMSWNTPDGTNGTVAYTVDGVSVSKKVVRQSLQNDNYAGTYMGALSWVNTCTGLHENFVDVVVTQLGSNVSVNWTNQATRDQCSFSGAVKPDGQFGTISGGFECGPVHDDGTFTFLEMRVTLQSLSGRYTSHDPDINPPVGCTSTGYLSATRKR